LQNLTQFQNGRGNSISRVAMHGSQFVILRARNKSRSEAKQQQVSSSLYHAAASGHDQMQQLFDDGTVC